MPRKTKTQFRFLSGDFTDEVQGVKNEAYKEYALGCKNQGKNPNKTDFVRFVFEFYLKNNKLL